MGFWGIVIAGGVMLAIGIGFEKLVRWGVNEGIVQRSYEEQEEE